MADTFLPVLNASAQSAYIDMRTETTNSEGRQVIVLGDPAVNANVVNAVTADPGPTSTTPGIVMRLAGSAQVQIAGATGSIQVFLPDTGHTLGKVDAGAGTFQVFLPDTGHELGSIRGNTNTLTIFLPDTGHELGSIRGVNSTVSVAFSPAGPLVLANTSATAVIGNAGSSVGGSTSAVSTSGATIVSPEASRNIKVYAFSLATTGVVSVTAKFTQGSGASPTTLWQVPLQSPASVASGANLAVQPPGYLFATGTGNTLSLVLDSATLVHYSVAYFKESA